VERGNRSIIDTFFEEGVEGSPYAGNIVDICPVGALVSKDFLHKVRAWDLEHTSSVCPNCSQGCNIEIHTRDNLVQLFKPRANPEINDFWMCDYGRARYEWINRSDRIEEPLVSDPQGRHPVGWEEALTALAMRGADLTGPVFAVATPMASNEALAGLAQLVEDLGGGKVVFRSFRTLGEVPLPGFEKLARREDLVPNRQGAEALGMVRVGGDDGAGGLEGLERHEGTLIVLGDELPEFDSSFAPSASFYLYLGSYRAPAAASAHFVLPVTTFAEEEGSFTNHAGQVQRYEPGLRAPGGARPAADVLQVIRAALLQTAGAVAEPEAT
jgi:NADH-quinone oxidoreductase subunit G